MAIYYSQSHAPNTLRNSPFKGHNNNDHFNLDFSAVSQVVRIMPTIFLFDLRRLAGMLPSV